MSGQTIMILVLGGAALAVALCLGLIQWRIGRLKRAVAVAKGWPTVPGRVVGGSIDTRVISLPRGRGVTYGVMIEYEYDLAGRRYRSTRFSLSGPERVSFEGRAKRRLARYPVGTPVTVSCDPAKPGEGVISLSAPAIFVFRFVFWFVLILAAWLIGAPLVFEPMFGPKPLIRL
jgi:hypothetical protein